MGIYGPRTVYVIALKDAPGCHEFLLQDDGKWLHVKETTEIGAASLLRCTETSPSSCHSPYMTPSLARGLQGALHEYLQETMPHPKRST